MWAAALKILHVSVATEVSDLRGNICFCVRVYVCVGYGSH